MERTLAAVALCALAAAPGCFADEQRKMIDTGRTAARSAQLQATLSSAAIAQQTVQATTGSFTADLATLTGSGGLRVPADISLSVARADAGGYCMNATEPTTAQTMHIASTGGVPAPGPC